MLSCRNKKRAFPFDAKGQHLWLNLRWLCLRPATAFFAQLGYTEATSQSRGNCLRVYVDGVMAINFLVDFLLLLGTNRLAGFPSDKKRLTLAALLGAVYSGVCLLPDFRFLGNLLWRVVSLGTMGTVAFGWNPGALRRCGVFLLLSLALGGLAVCIGRSDLLGLALAAGVLCLLGRFSFQGPAGSRDYVPLEITHGTQTVKLLALRDTGNTLRDPVTGEQVLVIAPWAACRLTGLTEQQLRHPLEAMGAVPGLRLIPFRTVGQGSGMMLAMAFDQVLVGNRRGRALVAFAPEGFGDGSVYQALTGGAAG